jgi:hypothetical protein
MSVKIYNHHSDKKNGRLVFSNQPLRRRTDEEIIRLTL